MLTPRLRHYRCALLAFLAPGRHDGIAWHAASDFRDRTFRARAHAPIRA